MKNIFKKKKPTALDDVEARIRGIEAELEECYSPEREAELYNQYYKLIDRRIEIEKLNKDKKWPDYVFKVLGIAAPLGVTIWGTYYTTHYEKEDFVSNTAGKNFFGRLFKLF